VDLSDGTAGQRSAGVAAAGPTVAERAAALQAGVELLEGFGVHLGRRQDAERRPNIDADQVVVTVAGRLGELRDVEPLVERLADGDVRLRVPLIVDLRLQLGERLLGRGLGLCCLFQVPRPPGQWVGTGVDDRAEAAGGELLNMSARPTLAWRHGLRLASDIPRDIPRHSIW
jgi:hypothetical protein